MMEKKKKLTQENKIIITGVTPSGDSLHLGNFFGAIKPLIDLGEDAQHQVLCFVADLHALTTVQSGEILAHNIKEVVLNYLAFGVDVTEKFTFFCQSEVSGHAELMVILQNYIGLGQMKRMHAYKDKLQKDASENQINMGLFNYPILMAADILLYGADLVPVGADQKQHVEITRDIALTFNNIQGKNILKLPEPLISEQNGKIVGTDGERKMSKSLGNIIGIFDDYSVIEKQIKKCFTDPSRLKATDPGRVEGNPIFIYHDLINMDKEEVADLKSRYLAGKVGDVEVKQKLLAAHKVFFAQAREKKAFYESNPALVRDILNDGAGDANVMANNNLFKVKKSVGLIKEGAKNKLQDYVKKEIHAYAPKKKKVLGERTFKEEK